MRRYLVTLSMVFLAASTGSITTWAQKRVSAPLSAADIDSIAILLMLEDARKYDEAELGRILKSAHPEVRRRAIQAVGRIADKTGAGLIGVARGDTDGAVAAVSNTSSA